MSELTFRPAMAQDAETILFFIRELAKYEKMEDDVVATPELLREWIFEKQKAEVIFPMVDGKEIGYALFVHNFSTFLGRAGLYLEDHFILPEYRGRGIAGVLLNTAVSDMKEKGISPLYLVTDHTGFYERYGWEFFCMVQGDFDEEPSRMYIHR